MSIFTITLFLTVFENYLIVVAEDTTMDERVAEKWCGSFDEGKCPHDPYCFNNEWGNADACIYCPTGGRASVCSTNYARDYRYERCNNSSHNKYYRKENFACTWRDNCPSSSNLSYLKYDEGCKES